MDAVGRRWAPTWRSATQVVGVRPGLQARGPTSDLVIGAGETQTVKNLAGAQLSADGTAIAGSTSLARGDQYSTVIYDPNPSPGQLRGAPQRYPARATGSTLVALPRATLPRTRGGRVDPSYYQAPSAISLAPVPARSIPTGVIRSARRGRRSSTRRTWRSGSSPGISPPTPTPSTTQSRRSSVTSDGPYRYDSQVHNYVYPLPAFLFVDRAGYCQQFSGTMALMLRLLGIPARVATGFAPGHLDPSSGDYDVRDLDAHSWVEVFFPKIGWVTFDPTPAAAPALTQGADALGHPVINSEKVDSADQESNLRGSKAVPTGTAALGADAGRPVGRDRARGARGRRARGRGRVGGRGQAAGGAPAG